MSYLFFSSINGSGMSKTNDKKELRKIEDDPDYEVTEGSSETRDSIPSSEEGGVCVLHFTDYSLRSFMSLEKDFS